MLIILHAGRIKPVLIHEANQDRVQMNKQQLEKKNAWLKSLVEVEFPTPESVLGSDLYLNRAQTYGTYHKNEGVTRSAIDPIPTLNIDALYRVDFHRLTIMFAQLHARYWSQNQDESAHVLEFLTQIILEPDYEIYVGFLNQEAVLGFILSSPKEGVLLMSDCIYWHDETVKLNSIPLMSDIFDQWKTELAQLSLWDIDPSKCLFEGVDS